MTHRIARWTAGFLVALVAAAGPTALAAGTAEAAPRSSAPVASVTDPAAGSDRLPQSTHVTLTDRTDRTDRADQGDRAVRAAGVSQAGAVAAEKEKKKGFFAKLGKFLLVVVILVILFFVLLVVAIVYAAKRIFGRRR
ncbi:hypothetical protein ACWC5I_29360 [Kitasatospora sp. NPDC001574]